MLGGLFMVGLPRPVLDQEIREFLLAFRPAGVILFGRNAPDLPALQTLCRELHCLPLAPPLLIAIDHEGGRVQRLGPPFTLFPPTARLGQSGSLSLAERVGEAMGRELQAAGIDWNFAPVLDVLGRPDNPVIGDRAFSSQPDRVARMGGALIGGLRRGGMIPCGKHFPGHGSTDADSHTSLPRVDKTFEELAQSDLVPFRRAIAARVESLMTAHVLYPALDPQFPATLSPAILTGLLRQKLGYRGVVLTDDLEMGAIADHFPIGEAAWRTLAAGADLLLICHSWEQAWEARRGCEEALSRGLLSPKRLKEADHRIRLLKKNHFRSYPQPSPSCIGSPEHQKLVAEILREAPKDDL